MTKERTALAIGGGLGLLIFGGVFISLSQEIQDEYSDLVQSDIPTESTQQPSENEGEIATVGQTFIQMMASYDQEQNQPIKLMSVEEKGSIWQAKYEVEQVFNNERSLVYFYTIDIDQLRVVRQTVAVSDRSRRILLSNPEPDSIIEQKGFTVKGQVFDGQGFVQVSLRNSDGQEVIESRVLEVNLDENGVYSTQIELPQSVFGEYVLQVADDQSIVEAAVVISQSN